MQNPIDVVQCFIKILTISIIFYSSPSQCFSIEDTSTETRNTITPSENTNMLDHSHNSDYNVYKSNKLPPKTEEKNQETRIGLSKILKKLEKEVEAHNNVKHDSRNKSFSIVNYMNTFVNNMINTNVNSEINVQNRKDGSKSEVVTVNPKINESNDIISVTMRNVKYLFNGFGNKRDGTIMKIPRNSNSFLEMIPLIEKDTKKENTKEEEDVDQPEELAVESTIAPFVKDDQNTHMILWNNNGHLNLNNTRDKTNENESDMSDFILPIMDKFWYRSEAEKKSNKTKIGSEWLPDIFSRIFSNFKINSKENDSVCNKESLFYQYQLKNLSLWAAKMYESSDFIPRGYIVGNGYQMGNFDECTGVRDLSGVIFGKYCLVETQLNFSRMLPSTSGQSETAWDIFRPARDIPVQFTKNKLYLSMCIPSGCGAEDLQYSLQVTLGQQDSELNESIKFQVHSNMCYAENQQKPASQGFIITCLLFATLSLLVISVSAYHLICYAIGSDMSSLSDNRYLRQLTYVDNVAYIEDVHVARREEGIVSYVLLFSKASHTNILLSFSAVTNLQKLFSRSDGELNSLHGIKFLSMCLIIMGHRLFYYFQGAVLDGENILHKFVEYDYILVHISIVETFFTIAGFLTYYTLYKKFKLQGARIIPVAILYRLTRLVPVYALIIAFVACVLPSIGNGPIYQLKIAKEVQRCQENWWTNLLFLNNYVHTNNSCLIQSWYLSCDLQLFLVGLIIMYVISKNEMAGMKLLYTCFVVSIVIPILVTWHYGQYGIMRLTTRLLEDPVASTYFEIVYSKTHNRASCYLLGMIASHVCLILKKNSVKFTVKQILVATIVTYIFMDGSQFYQWLFYIPDRPYYPIENALYAPLHKVLWSAGICAIIIVSITTGFGVLSPILNHSMYSPLSRLTYCALLIHTNIQLISIAAARAPEYLTYKKLGWMVGGDIMVTYVLAAVIYVLVEAPAGNLVDMALKRKESMNR